MKNLFTFFPSRFTIQSLLVLTAVTERSSGCSCSDTAIISVVQAAVYHSKLKLYKWFKISKLIFSTDS